MKKKPSKSVEEKIGDDSCKVGFSKYKIGLRNIKTALAVFLCLLVHFIVGPQMGLYACFAAVVCMRETVGKSWQIGWHRFLGTLIGGILGFILITIAQRTPYYDKGLYLIMIPIGLILCIWLCTLIDKKNGVVICCVVFIGIGLEPEFDKISTLYHVIIRVIDTTIGIVVAGLVNKYVCPYCEEEDLKCSCEDKNDVGVKN
ncbi:MAG: FUSC family protein [Aminipila sp.]